jgi:hypothetical protein
MWSLTAEQFSEGRRPARRFSISHGQPETLQDLFEALKRSDPEESQLIAMLGATVAHIAIHLGEPPNRIAILKLLDIKPGLQAYLREKGFKRNSIRSYTNYLRILLQRARELGWSESSPELAAAWENIYGRMQGSNAGGSRAILRYALRNGKGPADFTEADLNQWAEQALSEGRTRGYVRSIKGRFKKCVFDDGLDSELPGLHPPKARLIYGVEMSRLPPALGKQIGELLRWKTARFAPKRGARCKQRPISALRLRGFLCGAFGCLTNIKGRRVQSLQELLSEESVTQYVQWALDERGLLGSTLKTFLATIHGLAGYPALNGQDFSWVRSLTAQLPRDPENRTKDRKESRWVSYSVLAQVPEQIRHDARHTVSLNESSEALMFRNALLLSWLTTLPWRQRNIRECKVMPLKAGGNLYKEIIPPTTIAKPKWVLERLKHNPKESFWQFCFRPEETKTGNMVRAILPIQLVAPLEEYLNRHRPILVHGFDFHNLFLRAIGRPFTGTTLEELVVNVTRKYTGRPVNPHLFRDIFALQWLTDHPGDYLTLSKILWHRNIQTTLRIYGAGFDESYGALGVETWLHERNSKDRRE